MINLLPEDHKKNIRAARMNVVLLRYNAITLVAVGILLISLGGFYVYLTTTKAAAEEANSDNRAKANSYNATKKEADEYHANLATAKQILANEVNYTTIVFGVTELLPKGVILDNLNLSQKDFGNQTTFSARASSYEAARQLKQNFQESKLFSNVFFQTLNTSTDTTDPEHPILISISVKINKDET